MRTNWAVGDRIRDRWEIQTILKGGMGVVYVVYDHQWGEMFAAKSFQYEARHWNATAIDRFRQEALAWIRLDAHPNITRARMMYEIDSRPFLFLEYVRGGDLSRWIDTPRLTEDMSAVVRLGIQFCDGMIYAAQKGMNAHRDIKPQNCLLTEHGNLKISDFGLASVFEVDHDEVGTHREASFDITGSGSAAGTCAYMSPEQFEDAKRVDVRADVYSFGVMLFQMAAGRLPFVGNNWDDFRRLHTAGVPPQLTGKTSTLNQLIATCLSKQRSDRPANFAVVRRELIEVHTRLTGRPAPSITRGRDLNVSEWNNKGNALQMLGRFEEALMCFDQALELDADWELAWANRGLCLRRLGRLEEAIQSYARALSLKPNDAIVWSNKGAALLKLGRSQEALSCFDRTISLAPRDAQGWFNKGTLLIALDRDEEGTACLRQTVDLDPADPDAWYEYGFALGKQDRHEEEIRCYDRTLDLNPTHERAKRYRDYATLMLGQTQEQTRRKPKP